MEASIFSLLNNGRTVAEFWREWAETSNPWRAAWYDGDDSLELRIAQFLAFFVALHVAMLTMKKWGLLGQVLASRPTLVANHLHCTTVSSLAVYLLAGAGEESLDAYSLWQTVGIPMSVAYFIGDVFWYVIPGRYSPLSSSRSFDGLIFFHHVVMIACHYPVASPQGAALCGAGSALWATRLSLLGYLCELSNPLMNYRWWLMQTLESHRVDFSVVVVLLFASFALRIGLLAYLLAAVILPKAALFVEAKQVFIYAMCVTGHAVILLLSLYWLHVLTKAGMKRMLIFVPQKKPAGGGFTFGADMGRKQKSGPQAKAKAP